MAVVSIEDRLRQSLTVEGIAKQAGISRAQMRLAILGLAALDDEELVQIVQSAREDQLEAIHRITRREDAAEKAKQEARARREAKR